MSMTSAGRGVFITFEGLDGSGKSTQMRMLAGRLRAEGQAVIETAEPGGGRIGQQIRRILLDAANQELTATTELLLMFACRAQNVDELILPALAQGSIVLSDRFTDSTIAYQGYGRGLGTEVVLDVDRIACRGLIPDLTVCIDIDPLTSLARAHARNRQQSGPETRLDEQELEFYRKVHEGYRQLASEETKRIRMIDGSRSPEAVAADVWTEVSALIGVRAGRR
jgi:dTMP kinase